MSRFTRLLLLLLLWTSAAPALPREPAVWLKVQTPAQVTARQTFAVNVICSDSVGLEGVPVLLCLMDGAGVRLDGTLQARVVQGGAVFPAVVLEGGGETPVAIRLAAICPGGSHGICGLSDPVTLLGAPTPSFGQAVFDSVPTQVAYVPFLVTVLVTDKDGHPLPGAPVAICLDPEHNDSSALFFHDNTLLAGGSGGSVAELQAMSDSQGKATFWVRLSNAITPFDAALDCSVRWQKKTWSGLPSNVFQVFKADD